LLAATASVGEPENKW